MKWWQYLDWSTMEQTFKQLPELKRIEILQNGFWSLGKGKFENKTKVKWTSDKSQILDINKAIKNLKG